MTWLAITAGLLVIAGGLAIAHSRFSQDLTIIDHAWDDVAADFGRRHDLVPRLVEIIRGFAPHLGPELEDIVVARTLAIQMARQAPTRVALRADVENELTFALTHVIAAMQEQRGTADATAVMSTLDAIEPLHARIVADAHLYNLAVQGHNRRVAARSTRVVAALFGVERRPYLTIVDPASTALTAG